MGEESEFKPLLDRMWAEASSVLAGDRDQSLQSWVRDAIDEADADAARMRIGASYRALLDHELNDQRARHFSYLSSMGVEVQDRGDVYQNAAASATRAIELFESAEESYAGIDPDLATPIRVSIEKFFKGHLRGAILGHRDDKAVEPGNAPLGSGGGSDMGEGDAEIDVAGEADTQMEVLAALAEEQAQPLLKARMAVLRGCRAAASRLDLESPDLKVRRAGTDVDRIRRLLRPIILNFLRDLEELTESPDTSVATADEELFHAFRDSCRSDRLGELPDARDQFVHRNRPEAIWAASAVLRFWLEDNPVVVDQGSPEGLARLEMTVLRVNLGLRVIQPLTARLATRITSRAGEIGHRRFVANLAWLDDTLLWIQGETSAATVLELVSSMLATLHDTNATRRGSPAEVARTLVRSDDPRLATDADDLLALAERLVELESQLRAIAEGTRR